MKKSFLRISDSLEESRIKIEFNLEFMEAFNHMLGSTLSQCVIGEFMKADIVSTDSRVLIGQLSMKNTLEAKPSVKLNSNDVDMKQIQVTKRKLPAAASSLPSRSKKVFGNISVPCNAESVLTSKANADAMIIINQNLTTGEKSFQCSLCVYSSIHKSAVKRHVEIKHLPTSTVFKCQLCTVTATLKFNMKKHYIKTHWMQFR